MCLDIRFLHFNSAKERKKKKTGFFVNWNIHRKTAELEKKNTKQPLSVTLSANTAGTEMVYGEGKLRHSG